jgi:hypothetical protein
LGNALLDSSRVGTFSITEGQITNGAGPDTRQSTSIGVSIPPAAKHFVRYVEGGVGVIPKNKAFVGQGLNKKDKPNRGQPENNSDFSKSHSQDRYRSYPKSKHNRNGGQSKLNESIKDNISVVQAVKDVNRELAVENRKLTEQIAILPVKTAEEAEKQAAVAQALVDVIVNEREDFSDIMKEVSQLDSSSGGINYHWCTFYCIPAALICFFYSFFFFEYAALLISTGLVFIVMYLLICFMYKNRHNMRFIKFTYEIHRTDVRSLEAKRVDLVRKNPLYAEVEYTGVTIFGSKPEILKVSCSLLAEIMTATNMNPYATKEVTWERLYRTACSTGSINISYGKNVSSSIVSDTAHVALAIWLERREKTDRMGFLKTPAA